MPSVSPRFVALRIREGSEVPMPIDPAVLADIAVRYERVRPHLNERQRRLWAGNEALSLGWGGIGAVANVLKMATGTISKGKAELTDGAPSFEEPATHQIRQPGAGRKRVEDKDPGLLDALDLLVDPVTRGDPTSPLRWTSKGTEKLAAELTAQGHPVSADAVGRILNEQGYSLQSTRKRHEGSKHPDRDAQFHYLAQHAQIQLDQGNPVISVDTKSKELVGNFKQKGAEWQPKGEPVDVEAYDFPSMAIGKAAPYGVYDVLNNEGWVSVGISADTAEFAVNSIGQWWQKMGQARYEDADTIVITADCGGSNSYRTRLWKRQLQQLADELQRDITVLHYPPGTSKWNRIEHRMFNHITMNWRGRPLTSFEVVVQCIANTTTSTGLSIQAELDRTLYEKGLKVSDQEMAEINIRRHEFHGEWNYTISPKVSV